MIILYKNIETEITKLKKKKKNVLRRYSRLRLFQNLFLHDEGM